ncbi:MAG TPA: glycine cleavage system protein GcvH [Alphaproteobacteria bacterium]|nr:glycine cleavage system protein GcvH [Alphaproteobacteria bacterium]USO04972.1 MAG: glycine cleavage system protein GcvH [Rhodospirillales bacterium]HOO82215.1 glycine cleavage system protein GcvH [Alphaproteobacteria bacterium]
MAELKFTTDHEAIYVDGDLAWVGITEYAREALGDLVFVELPEIGKQVSKGDEFAVVESVKTAAEVYSPIDGEVVEANDNMPDDLELIAKPLADGGWIAKIKITDPAQLGDLMDEATYKDYLKTLD